MSTPFRIDIHVHLAGVGTGGSGCWISPRFERRYTFRLLRWWHGITSAQLRESVDQDWVDRVARMVRESELDRAVVLGFDGVYDERGEFDPGRSQLVVPPSWVFEACRRYPGELLPGPSVNPFRRDAMERLALLRTPLDAGVTVICAHSATPILLSRDRNQLPLMRSMLQEYPHLWADNSGMANPSRFAYLPRLAREPLFQARTLYGSDFPVPSNAVYFTARIGPAAALSLERVRNPFDRDVRIKRALGYPDRTLTRAERVLANLDRWRGSIPSAPS